MVVVNVFTHSCPGPLSPSVGIVNIHPMMCEWMDFFLFTLLLSDITFLFFWLHKGSALDMMQEKYDDAFWSAMVSNFCVKLRSYKRKTGQANFIRQLNIT